MATNISILLKDINYETFSLIWLDPQVNILTEYLHIQEKLRTIINYLKTFENFNQCEQYIQSISNYDRIILIINYQFIQDIISHIYQLRQISSIYVYDKTNEINEQLIKQYPKIKYVKLEEDELLLEIQSYETKWNLYKCDEPFSICIYKKDLNQDELILQMNNEFIYSQLLIDYLLRIEINSSDRMDIINFSREIYKNNKIQLNIIEQFKQTYSSNQALLWYTKNIFISKILNKAFYIQNLNIIFLFRSFLQDIQQEFKQNQYSSIIHLYKSQLLSNDELQILKDSLKEFISINSFFLTKFNRQLAISDFDYFIYTNNLQRILFEIDIDPKIIHYKQFTNINSSEILLMPGTIFHLTNIYFNNNHLWIIQMKLCNKNDENFKLIYNNIKEKFQYNYEKINLLTFGDLLWKMNKLDEAELYYLYLINLLSKNPSYLSNLYINLGHIYCEKNNYDLSLKNYHKSLEISLKILKSYDSNLANIYNAIATTYWKKGDYQQAFNSFNNALKIFKQSYGEKHINVGMCLNNMGTVISNELNYSKSLDYYLKALSIFEKYFPSNHPNLASLHSNIGTIYKKLNQINLALEHFNSALNIYENIYPSNHVNVIMILKNIAFLYEEKNDFQQAFDFYEKLSNIYRETLTITDPIIIQNDEKIQYLLSKCSINCL